MSKYISPSLRNKVVVNKPVEKVPTYEEEFPSLIDAPPAVKVWGGTKSFTAMVEEYKDKHEKEMQKQHIEKIDQLKFQRVQQSLPYISNIHNFIEPEDDSTTLEPAPKRQKLGNEEGWVTVEHHKYRKQKSIEEIANRPPTPPEENEDSVWNMDNIEEYETYDENNRR